MLSVIIPTDGVEQPAVATLAALVPGAAAGVIREVLLVDRADTNTIERVADVAGCHFLAFKGTRAAARVPLNARKWQPATSATRSMVLVSARSTSSTSRITPAAAPGTSAASVATAGCSTPSVGMMTLSMNQASMFKAFKNAALLSPCHTQSSRRVAAF